MHENYFKNNHQFLHLLHFKKKKKIADNFAKGSNGEIGQDSCISFYVCISNQGGTIYVIFTCISTEKIKSTSINRISQLLQLYNTMRYTDYFFVAHFSLNPWRNLLTTASGYDGSVILIICKNRH